MKREAKPILRSSKRHEASNMDDALATMARSGSIYFLKFLPRTAIPALAPLISVYLVVPIQFVREHGDKVEKWVILRVQSSNGRSSRPWAVRLSINMMSDESYTVRFRTGWKDFAAGNGLRMGDSLIFLLKEGVRSELEVYVFRGLEGTPYFPDLCANSTALHDNDDDEDEEEKYVSNSEEEEESFAEDSDKKYVSNSDSEDSDEDYKQIPVRSRVHHRDASTRASTGNGREGKAASEQQIEHSKNNKAFPGFRKLMTVSHIGRSTGTGSGQLEFPRHFVKTHGEHLQASVQLQGVHENSPVYVVPCFRGRHVDDGHLRISFKTTEWGRFVKANRLSVGQELRFSLTAESYFKARVI